MLDHVERSLISIKHRLQHRPTFLFFSGVNNNVSFVWPPCWTLLNSCMPIAMIYCLFLLPALSRECSYCSMANEHLNFQRRKLKHKDLYSNRKTKGIGVSETVTPRKARRWSDEEVDRSCAVFGYTNMARVCFLRILGRFWSQTLGSKCCIKHGSFVWPPR